MSLRGALSILIAVIAAGALFLITMTAAPPARETAEKASPEPGERRPPGFQAERGVTDPRSSGALPVQTVRDYKIERTTDRGLRVVFRGARFEPRPDGRARVKSPRVRIRFGSGRAVVLRAERAALEMPERTPRRGRLFGRVTATLYRGPSPEQLDLGPRSPHARVRLVLPAGARFDLELRRLTSDGPVILDGARFRFRGAGLELVWNELRGRLERLVVQRGERLVWHGPLPDRAGRASESAGARTTAPSTRSASRDEAGRIYSARIEKNVRLAGPRGRARARRLTAWFPFGGADGAARAGAGSSRHGTTAPTAGRTRPDGAEGATTLRFDGRLAIVPAPDAPPAAREGGVVRMTGGPVELAGAQGAQARAEALSLAVGRRRLVLDRSVRVAVPEAGELRADRLAIDLPARKARVPGTGRLTARAARDSSGLPLRVRWREGMTARFAVRDERRLEGVVFRGGVEAERGPLSLAAGRLRLGFRAGRRVGSLEAAENVRLADASRSLQATAKRLEADAEEGEATLFGAPVTLERPEGELVAPRVTLNRSRGAVEARGPGELQWAASRSAPDGPRLVTSWRKRMRFARDERVAVFEGAVESRVRRGREESLLRAERLRLALGRAEGGPATRPDAGGWRLRRVRARGDASLIARSRVGAKATRLRMRLGGETIRFDRDRERLRVDGPGSLLIVDRRPPADPGARPELPVSGRGSTLLKWDEGLRVRFGANDLSARGRVSVLHRPRGERPPVQLDAERVTVDLETTGGLGVLRARDAAPPGLRAIRAQRGVRIAAGQRTATCDALRYDGRSQTIVLRGDRDRPVSLRGDERAKAITAQAVRWGLADGRIEVLEPGAAGVSLP